VDGSARLWLNAGMAKRSVSTGGQQQTYRWRISQIRHRLEPLGDVEAPDEASAIKRAIEQYQITEPQRSLLAKRYG
jgi:hypothetical protein